MTRRFRLALLACLPAMVFALPAQAVPGGKIGTLKRGEYACEWPGDAAGEDWRIRAEDQDFEITSASRYAGADGHGTYLRTGDKVLFTSGPRKGQRFELKSESYLRRLGDDGKFDSLRCVRRSPNNR